MANERKIQEGFYEDYKTKTTVYVEKQDSSFTISYVDGEMVGLADEEHFLKNFMPVDPRKKVGQLEKELAWIKKMMEKQPIEVPDSDNIPMVS